MATMLIYLEDTEKGGETIFPNGVRPEDWDADEPGNHNSWSDCAKKGIPVKSHRGDAVLFWSLKEDYTLDNGSLHGACPVIKGEKWTAVKWIRVAKFDGGFTDPLPMPALARSDRSKGECLDEWWSGESEAEASQEECEKWEDGQFHLDYWRDIDATDYNSSTVRPTHAGWCSGQSPPLT